MGQPAGEAKEPETDGATTEATGTSDGDTNVDTGGGDAVINEAPDGGGVDNNAGEADTSSNDSGDNSSE